MDAMNSFGTEMQLVLPMLITAGGAFLILLLRALTSKALPYGAVAIVALLGAIYALYINQSLYESSVGGGSYECPLNVGLFKECRSGGDC